MGPCMKLLLICSFALFTVTLRVNAECTPSRNAASRIVCNSTEDLDQLLSASDRGIPRDLLNKAACVIVVPDLKKGGFIVGGEYGRGLFSCRKSNGVGWSAPGFIKVMGG